MKNTETFVNTPPPQISVIENANQRPIEKRFGVISDSYIKDPSLMNPSESSDAIASSVLAIVGNERLEKLAMNGLKSDIRKPYAEIINYITQHCVSLTDQQIDSVVVKFMNNLRVNAEKCRDKYNLSVQEFENLRTGRWNDRRPQDTLNTSGIKSAVHFLRARKVLHRMSPQTIPAIYFENSMDFSHGIDFIEVVETSLGVVINLIQVKSHEYSREEIDKYTKNHKKWADEFFMDVNEYEQSFYTKPADERIKVLNEKLHEISDILLEILTDSESGEGIDILYNKLGLGAFPLAEQLWILNEYLPFIKEACDELASSQEVGVDTKEQLNSFVFYLQKKIDTAMERKRGLQNVVGVNSICANGNRESSNVSIFRTDDKNRAKAIKIN